MPVNEIFGKNMCIWDPLKPKILYESIFLRFCMYAKIKAIEPYSKPLLAKNSKKFFLYRKVSQKCFLISENIQNFEKIYLIDI